MDTTQVPPIHKPKKSVKDTVKQFFLRLLRLTDQPVVKVYRGFGNDSRVIIYGHVFRRSALPRRNYRDIDLVNLLAVIRLFLIRPYSQATVEVRFSGQQARTQTDQDGYFQFELLLNKPLSPGWHNVSVQLISGELSSKMTVAEGEGQVLIPHPGPFICISDIDDTFLVSHSATITKRLLVLLTENAHSRIPFEGVVAHYQLLAGADTGSGDHNPFFYVSSSEWNLYDYILEFSKKNGLPEGIYRLSKLKRLSQLLKTGKGKHHTKVDRITQIIDMYPDRQFILLGDDSQLDPSIYTAVVERYPGQIRCVYIRQIYAKHKPQTESLMTIVDKHGVERCYFAHSADARQHSIDIGLTIK
ncbi:App1 family protein [Spirosoma harenae]